MTPEPHHTQAIRDIEEKDALIAQAMQFAKGQFHASGAEILDLGGLARDVADRYADMGADICLSTESAVTIRGESGILQRTLSNLLDNALGHAGATPVKLSVQSRWDQAVLIVEDEGPGIPADQLERDFEPFDRLESSRSRRMGGAGLGLAIARHAVRSHGGELTLSNAISGGLIATMSFLLSPSPSVGHKTAVT